MTGVHVEVSFFLSTCLMMSADDIIMMSTDGIFMMSANDIIIVLCEK